MTAQWMHIAGIGGFVDMSQDYQKSKFYAESLKVCPWKDTDHMGERLHNYCTWCEGYVAGAESREEQLTEMADMWATAQEALAWFVEVSQVEEGRVFVSEMITDLPQPFVDAHLKARHITGLDESESEPA